jgi:short-subunit dehydrogenase
VTTDFFSSKKPWVAITGASSGIGKATALHLARAGYGVVLASEQAQALRQVQAEIQQLGGRAEVVDLDLLEPGAAARFYDQVTERVGFCEVLVNNAGIGLHKTLEESTDNEFQRVFAVNFFSIVSICRSAVAVMKQHGRGHIINVSSASARRSLERMSCYGASKGAVHCFSQALRAEVAQDGIAVTEILPISVSTPFFDTAGYQPKGLVQTPESLAVLVERAILRRPAELCSSRLAQWGFVLDCLAPNLVAYLMNWHTRWARRKDRAAG